MTTITKLMDLKGRTALITGAAGGLGRVVAETLAELGADLILVDRPGSNLQQRTEQLGPRWGVHVKDIFCDLEQSNQRQQLIAQVKAMKSGLNILVNNAAFVGTSELKGWSVPFEQQSVDTWRRAVEVNLTAVFELTQGFSSDLSVARGGCIINIASIYGEYGPDWRLYEGTQMGNPAAYGASKGGLIQFTRWLSTTLAPAVRANCISPGGISRGQSEAFVARYVERTPLGRMATEEDFRGAVAYLASDLSSYVTGQNLSVDGGWGVW
jgi:NAD(P)-dependent dehydrogenase (short-subunit alcohol dehydrogenase family)